MKWNDYFPLIVSLFLLYDCRHLKNYHFISFQNIIFFKKSMTYTGINASYKSVSYLTQNSVSKYGIPSFRLLARVRGLWDLQNNTGCYHSSWLFITLGFKTYYWTYPILGSQDMDKSSWWWSRSFYPHGNFSIGQKLLWRLFGKRSHQESNSAANPKSYNN